MTPREKILGGAVALLLIAGGGQWTFSKYRDAVQSRETQLEDLTNTQMQLNEKVKLGKIATRQMSEFEQRSLSSNVERAKSDYQRWLLDVVTKNGIKKPKVDPTTTLPISGLYTKLGFRVSGEAEFIDTLNLMHDFYSKDYLHRITKLDVTPSKTGGFTVKMSVDAMAMKAAPEIAPEPDDVSWQIAKDANEYLEPILNRNFFEPPNQAPKFTGKTKVEAYVGKRTPIPLTFDDPEKHGLSVELTGDEDDRISLDTRNNTLYVISDEKGDIDIDVRVTDQGYPRRSVDQSLTVAIVDEPEPEPTEEPPEFDEASQTYLTALVQGGNDWVAWMNVRTRGETLKLRVGDGFEIGTVKGKVTDITADFVEIEIDGKRITFDHERALKDAAKKIEED